MGFELWVKQITGFGNAIEIKKEGLSEQDVENLTLKVINKLFGNVDLKELKIVVEESNGFKKGTITLPGLRQQHAEYAEQGNNPVLNSSYFTLDQWLKTKGLTLTHPQKCSIGRLVAGLYKINKQSEPKKMLGSYLVEKVNGRVTAYTSEDEPMLNAALAKFYAMNN